MFVSSGATLCRHHSRDYNVITYKPRNRRCEDSYTVYTRAYTGILEPDSSDQGTSCLRVYVRRFSSTLHASKNSWLAPTRQNSLTSYGNEIWPGIVIRLRQMPLGCITQYNTVLCVYNNYKGIAWVFPIPPYWNFPFSFSLSI